MKFKSISKLTLLAAFFLGGTCAVWADPVVVPTPVYFNDFSFATSGSEGIEIVGNGVFENDTDAKFGRIFHNDPTLTKAIRTNWLELPNTVFSSSTETKELSIGFWVNKKNAADYFYSPLFTAYGNDNLNDHSGDYWYPFFYIEARGVIRWNSGGWCDFTAEQNDKGTNQESTVWTDDGEWHYVTLTFTTSSAKLYIDGEIFNSWTIADNGLAGLFTQTDLKHFCLGGNQAFAWNDPDPAFGFDDVAIYNKALTKAQIDQIRANKLERTFTGTAIGAVDNSTDYLGALSTKVTLKPGESYHYSFINYNKGENTYNNWILPVYDASDNNVIVVRTDNWEDKGWANDGCTSNYVWDYFPGELNGATVDMTVTFTAEKVFQMTSTITTVGGSKWTYSYTNDYTDSPISLTSNDYIKVALSVSRSWIDLLSEGYSAVAADINSTGWSTFSSDYALDFSSVPATLKAYMITDHSGDVVTTSKVTGTVPAGTGLLLNGTASTSYNIPIVGSSDTNVDANLLVAGQGTLVTGGDNMTFVLAKSKTGDQAMFKKLDGTATIAKGKAYLKFKSAVTAPALFFNFGDVTGIDATLMNSEKRIANSVYDLQGRKVAQPAKGLYIVNGKKYVVK